MKLSFHRGCFRTCVFPQSILNFRDKTNRDGRTQSSSRSGRSVITHTLSSQRNAAISEYWISSELLRIYNWTFETRFQRMRSWQTLALSYLESVGVTITNKQHKNSSVVSHICVSIKKVQVNKVDKVQSWNMKKPFSSYMSGQTRGWLCVLGGFILCLSFSADFSYPNINSYLTSYMRNNNTNGYNNYLTWVE